MVEKLQLFHSSFKIISISIFVLKKYRSLIVCIRIMIIVNTTMIVLLKQRHQRVSQTT